MENPLHGKCEGRVLEGRRCWDVYPVEPEYWDAGMLAPVKSASLAFGISRGKDAGILVLECWKRWDVGDEAEVRVIGFLRL